ncbi:type IV pilus modification protein PilV [Methyloglobulus sp.]|uniref:type IV pilus modification protein PilV n=1 Tax=Methyloglobulus sp. TaxID=2518622 RepID=UPI003989FA48
MTKTAGFTLIEVLITMVVLAVGLLGLAGLQSASLGNNQKAYNRSQATQLAYDMADRMRANRADAGLFVGSAYPGTVPPAPAQVAACGGAPGGAVAGCTPAQMAQNDLFEWSRDIGSALPNSAVVPTTAVIAVVPPAPPIPAGFTITISWDDNRNGVIDPGEIFQMRFEL